jgi:CheY-like chemotaxis protein
VKVVPEDNLQLSQLSEVAPATDNGLYSILIVEDCDQSRELMYNLFASQGFTCHTAENGRVAMDILNSNKIDVILLDIMMPIMNGYQVIKAVKSSQSLLHIPIIAITGNDSPDGAVRCIELGAEDYLNKPFDPLMLKTRVNAHIEKKRLRDIEIDYRKRLEEQNAMLEERVREQVTEIMERWKAEEELRKAKARAEEETLLRDKFVSLVSHDLRSPLSSVIGLMRLIESNLASNPDDSSQMNAGMMRRAVNSCNDLIKMIDQLLSISRLKMGSLKPISAFHNAKALVGLAVANMSFLAKEKNITIINETPADMRLFIDRQLTLEVLQNLISNAIKFSESGSTVTIFSPNESTNVIAIKDTGVGISEDMAINIFRHDIRTTTTGTRGERGTGLGLPLCKDIMEAHGGSIRVESREGEGSVFYLEFKRVRPLCLLVDDKEEMRYILKSILSKMDADVLEAENGSAAINMLDSITPHLIVTDLQMPVMDGYKLLRTIRNNPRIGKTPVVVVTSDIDLETRDKAMKMGADEFFTTPVTQQDFLPRISKLVG